MASVSARRSVSVAATTVDVGDVVAGREHGLRVLVLRGVDDRLINLRGTGTREVGGCILRSLVVRQLDFVVGDDALT